MILKLQVTFLIFVGVAVIIMSILEKAKIK